METPVVVRVFDKGDHYYGTREAEGFWRLELKTGEVVAELRSDSKYLVPAKEYDSRYDNKRDFVLAKVHLRHVRVPAVKKEEDAFQQELAEPELAAVVADARAYLYSIYASSDLDLTAATKACEKRIDALTSTLYSEAPEFGDIYDVFSFHFLKLVFVVYRAEKRDIEWLVQAEKELMRHRFQRSPKALILAGQTLPGARPVTDDDMKAAELERISNEQQLAEDAVVIRDAAQDMRQRHEHKKKKPLDVAKEPKESRPGFKRMLCWTRPSNPYDVELEKQKHDAYRSSNPHDMKSEMKKFAAYANANPHKPAQMERLHKQFEEMVIKEGVGEFAIKYEPLETTPPPPAALPLAAEKPVPLERPLLALPFELVLGGRGHTVFMHHGFAFVNQEGLIATCCNRVARATQDWIARAQLRQKERTVPPKLKDCAQAVWQAYTQFQATHRNGNQKFRVLADQVQLPDIEELGEFLPRCMKRHYMALKRQMQVKYENRNRLMTQLAHMGYKDGDIETLFASNYSTRGGDWKVIQRSIQKLSVEPRAAACERLQTLHQCPYVTEDGLSPDQASMECFNRQHIPPSRRRRILYRELLAMFDDEAIAATILTLDAAPEVSPSFGQQQRSTYGRKNNSNGYIRHPEQFILRQLTITKTLKEWFSPLSARTIMLLAQ